MNSAFILKITSPFENRKIFEKIFNYTSNSKDSVWEYCIEDDSHLFKNALPFFLDLLETKSEVLSQINIEDISIWYFYEYIGQCNIEFQPDVLKRLGNLKVTLCISCWEGNT
jgi:hypothetical protein